METSESLKRAVFRIEFDGSPFRGWQLQSAADENLQPSIQGEIERALTTVLRSSERISIKGCGRTDAGVHAYEFYFHAELPTTISDLEKLRHALSSVLPTGISVLSADWAPAHFHAADSVTGKTYEYRILLRRAKPALGAGRVWWIPGDLEQWDLGALQQSLKVFEGEHDFVAFAAANQQAATTRRTLRSATVEVLALDTKHLDSGHEIRLRFEAKGFLKQMVRNMVGAVVEVAQKKRSLDSLRELLDASAQKIRKDAGYCAPSDGLFLLRVSYDGVQ
jgi:tRNA pseudouridine38-40 synthase